MSDPQNIPAPDDQQPAVDSSNSMLVEVVGGDTTRRPVSPEHIAAVKRYWERMGRKPPPPYDRL